MKTIEIMAGYRIEAACREAAAEATRTNEPVRFMFNETEVTAQPGDDPETLTEKWCADHKAAAEAYRASPEYKADQERHAKESREKDAAIITESAKTEAEMRETEVPWPRTPAQLTEYIESLVKRDHDYGTCVYAMSLAAVAAFNYVSHKLGVTGFQASCADLDILRRTRSIKGPFMIIKGEDALYPQYNIPGKLDQALQEWRPWLAEQAAKKLAETPEAHPNVLAHWRKLACPK